MADWQGTMRRYYKLLHPLILAHELGQGDGWRQEPHLLVIVNALNRQYTLRSHEEDFYYFQRHLLLPTERTHLVTWQALLDRAKATFEPGVRPLLDHAAELSYLQPPKAAGPDWAR